MSEAVNSALQQTYPDIEVIVVDDGSTDGTQRVISGYGDAIVGIHQANRGPGAARNLGVSVSSGEYLGFLDADDVWSPSRVERCLAHLERHGGSVVTTDAIWFTDDGRELGRHYQRVSKAPFASDNQVAALVHANFMFASGILRRWVFDEVGPFTESVLVAEDYDLWLRLAAKGVRLELLDEPLARYRVRDDSLSRRPEAQDQHYRTIGRNLRVLEPFLSTPWAAITESAARVAMRDGDRGIAADITAITATDPSLGAFARRKLMLKAIFLRIQSKFFPARTGR